jgi:hypothetical protein
VSTKAIIHTHTLGVHTVGSRRLLLILHPRPSSPEADFLVQGSAVPLPQVSYHRPSAFALISSFRPCPLVRTGCDSGPDFTILEWPMNNHVVRRCEFLSNAACNLVNCRASLRPTQILVREAGKRARLTPVSPEHGIDRFFHRISPNLKRQILRFPTISVLVPWSRHLSGPTSTCRFERSHGQGLVAFLRKRLGLEASLYQTLQILSVTLFEKTPFCKHFRRSTSTTICYRTPTN